MTKNQEQTTDLVDLLLGEATYVKGLPTSTDSARVAVFFDKLTKTHCKWWDTHVQPHIALDNSRADKDWRWPTINLLSYLTTPWREVIGYAMTMSIPRGGENTKYPIGLLLLVTPFPHLNDHNLEGNFLWWLSVMPKSAADDLKIEPPRLIGSSLLDFCLTDSFKRKYQGRVSLHADPEGQEMLSKWYSARGMLPVSPDITLPGIRGIFLNNDGRYFVYQPKESLTAYTQMDQWR